MRSLTILWCALALTSYCQAQSVLSSGAWYKLSVEFDGVYKIDYNLLKKAGFNVDAIDPRNVQVYASSNGMLAQANNAPRIGNLQETSIYVKGESDGKFNKEDYILFYGQGPDAYTLLPNRGVFQYQNNLYTDRNYYFIRVGDTTGKRVQTIETLPGSFPSITEFDDFAYYETEEVNQLHSGRDWYGELFDSKTEYTIRFEIPGIAEGSNIKLVSNVMSQSFGTASFQIFWNDTGLGEQVIPPIINSQFAVKGNERTDTLLATAAFVNAPSRTNQDIKIKFIKAPGVRSVGYLDYLQLQVKRRLNLYGDQTIFHSLASLQQPVSQFIITGMPANGMVWDITDPFNTHVQQTLFQSNTSSFSANSGSLKKYIAISNNFLSPKTEGSVANQNLLSTSPVDLLIISAPEFLSEAQRLADHRQAVNGVNTRVVTTTEVYNDFSGGKQDVTALRDAVRFLYVNNTGISNVLLFGRGSYDYKNYLSFNKNFVPTYESRNSLSPLETYSSDDYFGFLETNEGTWAEDVPQPHTLDVGIGRFPVKKIEEARIVVDKLIEYEDQNWGTWRKQILFLADDGDFNIHQAQADQLAESVDFNHPEFNVQKVYLDSYKQLNSPIGQLSPKTNDALVAAVRTGVVIVNFTGHGSEQQWMQERIFDQVSLDRWKTGPNYPLLLTATCEFGRNDDPGLISTAELSFFRKDGGSIGLVTTARPVSSSTNFSLNIAFYQSLFVKVQNQYRDLGTVFRDTKNNSISGVSNRNFSLLGDPSMHLAMPASEIRATGIVNLTSGSDTLKGLSKVRVTGEVYRNGIADATFNGIMAATLFDKAAQEVTKGDENTPFDFLDHENAVFRGQASVHNGQFSIEFTMPKSIDPVVGTSKLGLYASSANYDVTGAKMPIKIGALEKNPGVDSKGPGIELFMGDTTYVDGGIVGTNSKIVAILTDENGINISDFIPDDNIIATLDDSLVYILNKYYVSDVDNAKRGKLSYPLDGLKAGNHTLTLRATDTYGNHSSATLAFYVSDQSGIQIEQWISYPNPVQASAVFRFRHNRSGEDIEAAVSVFDQLGKPMLTNTYQITHSPYQVDLPPWDAASADGTKLSSGLYLLKLSVRSLEDGSKNEKITKVIITN